jgi:hypothetical protein
MIQKLMLNGRNYGIDTFFDLSVINYDTLIHFAISHV